MENMLRSKTNRKKEKANYIALENCMTVTSVEIITKHSNNCLMKLSKYDQQILNMTREEFINKYPPASCIHTSALQANITNIVISKIKRAVPTSSSCNNDEGYGTAGSTSSVRFDISRTFVKKPKPKKKLLSRSSTRIETPLNEMITPKVKPGTPLVLFRRPKMREFVVSMQGSPVLTGPVLAEDRPNINIPLPNGTVMSLQAEEGLRRSHLPEMDADVMNQLQILRRNLEIVSMAMAQ